jgi:hypothetical protein
MEMSISARALKKSAFALGENLVFHVYFDYSTMLYEAREKSH